MPTSTDQTPGPPPAPDASPVDLLRRRLRANPAGPLLTFYDATTGERVELSATTLTTWVAKIAHLLRDDLGLAPGDRVGLLMRPHWLAVCVCGGVWAAGCTPVVDLAPDEPADLAAVAVTSLDPALLHCPAVASAGDVLAVSTRPLAAPYDEDMPGGVIDLVTEARGHPDALVVTPAPSPADGAAWVAAARQRVNSGRLPAGARVLVPTPAGPDVAAGDGAGRGEAAGKVSRPLLVDAFVVPLLVGGSAVLVRGGDTSFAESVARAERVTTVLDYSDEPAGPSGQHRAWSGAAGTISSPQQRPQP